MARSLDHNDAGFRFDETSGMRKKLGAANTTEIKVFVQLTEGQTFSESIRRENLDGIHDYAFVNSSIGEPIRVKLTKLDPISQSKRFYNRVDGSPYTNGTRYEFRLMFVEEILRKKAHTVDDS